MCQVNGGDTKDFSGVKKKGVTRPSFKTRLQVVLICMACVTLTSTSHLVIPSSYTALFFACVTLDMSGLSDGIWLYVSTRFPGNRSFKFKFP